MPTHIRHLRARIGVSSAGGRSDGYVERPGKTRGLIHRADLVGARRRWPSRWHWRGWVQHVRNGHQAYFTNLRDLNTFIEGETGIDRADNPTIRGLM